MRARKREITQVIKVGTEGPNGDGAKKADPKEGTYHRKVGKI